MKATDRVSTPSANASTQIHSDLQDVFDWRPISFNSTETGSENTRLPAPYDRHMDKKLRLRRVVYAESIIPDITKVVDECLRNSKLPNTASTDFERAHKMTAADIKRNRKATKPEAAVSARYTESIARPLIPVASTIALGLPDWKGDFFTWSPYADTQDFAIGDGFFKVSPQSTEKHHLPEDTTRILTAMEKCFPNIGVWEFKSVFAGSERRMVDILALAKEDIDFPWVTCSETSKDCKSHYGSDGSESVTGARMGFDAVKPVCSLPEKTRIRSQQRRVRQGPHKPDPAVYVIQQIWAEAVREDATFIVLHSGDREMIFYRDRTENILFVSNIIYVSKQPGYGKIQIGLYISMYLDAFDRTSQILHAISSRIKLPDAWLRRYNVFTSAEKEAKKKQKKTRSKVPLVTVLARQTEIARDARILPSAIVEMKKQSSTGFFTIPRPMRFYRVNSTPNAADIPRMRVVVDELIDRFVYHAKVKVNSTFLDRELVIKMAGNKDDTNRLLQEFNTYKYLSSRVDGMADIFGCFTSDPFNPEVAVVALVMRHHGYSLASQEFATKHLLVIDRIHFMTLLQKIHSQGYCHNDITRHKLLFDSDGASVKVIGLGRAMRTDGDVVEKLQRQEFRTLEEVLNNAEMERVENAEGARPSKRPRRNSDSVTSVLRTVSAALLGPIETADVQFVSEEISRRMSEDSTFPSGTISRFAGFIYIEFPRGEDGKNLRKIWESEDIRLQIPLQQWERRDKVL